MSRALLSFSILPCVLAASIWLLGVCSAGPLRADEPRSGPNPASTYEVSITGNKRVPSESIRSFLSLPAVGLPDAAAQNAALKRLFATGQFADARIEARERRLLVTVVENPLIAAIDVKGSKAIERKELLKTLGIKAGEPWTRARGETASRLIRESYEAKGHADAKVDVAAKPRLDSRVDVTFTVAEGTTAKIAGIDFIGNHFVASDQLRDVITTRASSLFDFIRGTTPHDQRRLEHDRELLLRHYRKLGYADAEINPAVSTRDPKTGAWHIQFRIREGERYAFGPINVVSGDNAPKTDAMRRALTLREGERFDANAMGAAVERLTTSLVDSGRLDVEVTAEPRRDPATRRIAVDFKVNRIQRLYIERIEIAGNRRTRDHVIRRELRFAEGDAFHPILATRARKRLLRLPFFKSVDIEAKRGSSREKVRLRVAVEEQNSLELGFGVGYSSSEGIIGDISMEERNLFGRGQRLKLLIAGSETRREAQLSFTEPYFLGRPLAAGFDLFYRDQDLQKISSYQSTRYGGTVRLGFDVAENTRATVSYTLSRNIIHDVGPAASLAIKQAVPGYPSMGSAAYNTSAVGYNVAYDTRDKPKLPMSGVLISTSQDLAGLGGDTRYLRNTVEARAYLPVTDRIALATRVMGGTISGWGGSEVRLLDMFYRGGETVRGFAVGGIGPRDVLSANRDALGGTSYLATTAELRVPLPFVPDSVGLRAAFFADAGTLWGSNATTKATPGVVGTSAALRASTGAGLIWDSPVGPLRVDYAQVLMKQSFDKTQALSFGLMPGF